MSEPDKTGKHAFGIGTGGFIDRKKVAWPELIPDNKFAQPLRWRGRLIDPVKENLNNKMLKKYTKYAATAFAVASLSTFMIGCGEADEFPVDVDPNDDGMPATNSVPPPDVVPGGPEVPPGE